MNGICSKNGFRVTGEQNRDGQEWNRRSLKDNKLETRLIGQIKRVRLVQRKENETKLV